MSNPVSSGVVDLFLDWQGESRLFDGTWLDHIDFDFGRIEDRYHISLLDKSKESEMRQCSFEKRLTTYPFSITCFDHLTVTIEQIQKLVLQVHLIKIVDVETTCGSTGGSGWKQIRKNPTRFIKLEIPSDLKEGSTYRLQIKAEVYLSILTAKLVEQVSKTVF